MGYWLCKKHGKTIHVPACIHLKQSVENGRLESFNLVLEEISQADASYISTLLCDSCASEVGLPARTTIFFDPQVRKFEQNVDDDLDEKDAQYQGIFDHLSEKLTSICQSCLLDVLPNYLSIIDARKADAVEVEKK